MKKTAYQSPKININRMDVQDLLTTSNLNSLDKGLGMTVDCSEW